MDINDIWLTNIRYLVDTEHNGRQAGLAEKLGKQPNVISRLFSKNLEHKRNVTAKLVRQIESLYQLPSGWMNSVHNNEEQVSLLHLQDVPDTARETKIHNDVPLISWAQVSQWNEASNIAQSTNAETRMACPTSHSKNTFALRVCGISMEPKYQDGDIIFVDPDERSVHGRNVIVHIEESDEVIFKQLFTEGTHKYLRALNTELSKKTIIEVNEHTIICGVVIGKWVPE